MFDHLRHTTGKLSIKVAYSTVSNVQSEVCVVQVVHISRNKIEYRLYLVLLLHAVQLVEYWVASMLCRQLNISQSNIRSRQYIVIWTLK